MDLLFDAVHDVGLFVALQDSVVSPSDVEVGLAVSVTTGTGFTHCALAVAEDELEEAESPTTLNAFTVYAYVPAARPLSV